MKRRWIAIIGLLVAWGAGAVQAQQGPAEEQPPRGIQISPVRFEETLRAGESWHGSVRLKNFSEETVTLTISAEDFTVSEDTEDIHFYKGSGPGRTAAPEVAQWITFARTRVTLAPGAVAHVPFTITVPADAPTGGYYGAIFATHRRTVEGSGARIGINSRIGTLVILAVRGAAPARVAGAIEHFAPTRSVFFATPATFQLLVRNTGNLHFRAGGTVTIRRGARTVAQLPIASRVNYPSRVRLFTPQWTFSAMALGPYDAVVHYATDDRAVTLTATTRFWVVPWTTIALVVFLIVLLLVGRYVATHYTVTRKT